MKQLIRFNPGFSPGAPGSGTIDFSGMATFNFGRLYAIINATSNAPLYVSGATGYGLTVDTVNNKKFTIQADTSTHSVDDELNIYYEMSPLDPVSIGSPTLYGTNVSMEQGGQIQLIQEKLDAVLVELKLQNELLIQGLIGRPLNQEDSISLRNDIADNLNKDNIHSQL